MNKEDQIKEQIAVALEIVDDIQNESLKVAAFNAVLSHLLSQTAGSEQDKGNFARQSEVRSTSQTSSGDSQEQVIFDTQRLASQLSIDKEAIDDLYRVENNIIFLRIKPPGASVSEQSRILAQTLIVGYRFGLNIKDVELKKLREAAKEWGVEGPHFARDIAGEGIQKRAKGRKPLYSLSPGAVDALRAKIISLTQPNG